MSKISIKKKITLVIFGLSLAIILLEIVLRIGGFVLLSLQEQKNRILPKQKAMFRVLCLGDSTTYFGGRGSYPVQLEGFLNKTDTGRKFQVLNKGVPGIETDAILFGLEENLNKYKPDILVVMMGINDFISTSAYEESLKKKTSFFIRDLRVYKLVNFVRLYIIDKTEKVRRFKTRQKRKYIINRKKIIVENMELKKIYKEEEIEIDPNDDKAYIGLGNCYREEEKYTEAEQMYKRAIELNSDNDEAYFGLGYCFKEVGRYEESVQMFKKAKELNPYNSDIYVMIGNCYREEERYTEAEQMYRRAIELNPDNDEAYFDLGYCYREEGRYKEAEENYRKSVEKNPDNNKVYFKLGYLYRLMGRYREAEVMQKKAIESYNRALKINPYEMRLYLEMATCNIELLFSSGVQGRDNEVEDWYSIVLNAYPYGKKAYAVEDRYYGLKAIICMQRGELKDAENYFKKANEFRLKYYNLVTKHNYRKLKEIAVKKGITLVCVQYPVYSIEPLKNFLDSEKDIVFVDNEKIFKDALQYGKFEDYFINNFGGEFGHFTYRGRQLLAENIADVIRKEIFNKQ